MFYILLCLLLKISPNYNSFLIADLHHHTSNTALTLAWMDRMRFPANFLQKIRCYERSIFCFGLFTYVADQLNENYSYTGGSVAYAYKWNLQAATRQVWILLFPKNILSQFEIFCIQFTFGEERVSTLSLNVYFFA